MAARICSKCGYEGRGKRSGKGGGGGVFRLLGMLTLLPVFSVWRLFSGGRGNMCPHCGLPTMVRMNSEAGRMAQRIADIELGLIQPKKPLENKLVEAVRPAERVEPKKPVDPEQF